MPNTPALIGKGITGLFADAAVNDADRALVETICNAVGQTVWVAEEKLMAGYLPKTAFSLQGVGD
jgi:pyrroline-5-carboxylate reductase